MPKFAKQVAIPNHAMQGTLGLSVSVTLLNVSARAPDGGAVSWLWLLIRHCFKIICLSQNSVNESNFRQTL
jgi:hypothetical protein